MLLCEAAYSQNIFRAIIRDDKTKAPLAGATAQLIQSGDAAISGSLGIVEIKNIKPGNIKIAFSYAGYQSKTADFTFPVNDTVEILLEAQEENLEEVVIQSTRTSRTIKNTPTRVETIDAEEVDEKNNMRPANVSMLLHESTGMQVQQTSATSGSASIRVQGVDGR